MVYIFIVIYQCPSFTINNKHAPGITKDVVWCIFNLSKIYLKQLDVCACPEVIFACV